MSKSVVENNPLVLNCEVPDSLPLATVTWFKGSSIVSDDNGRIGQTLNGRLVFSHFEPTDTGQYHCKVENELISESSAQSSTYLLSLGNRGNYREGD